MSVSARTHAHRVPEGRSGPTLQHLPASEHGHGLIGAEARSTFRRAGEVVGWPPGPPWALWPGTASSLFCRAFPWAPQSHPSALGPERGSSNGFFAKYSYLLSAEPKLQWSCAWDGTALIGDPHYSQRYRKHPSLRRGGTPPHCIGPMGAKEGVGWNQSRLQDSIFFPSPSLLTYTHFLSLSHTHTHTCRDVYFISSD